MNYNKGFTLAEVLISLVIIGIIASMTVSNLIQSTQKQEYVSMLKKAHSTLVQALYKVSIDSGYPLYDFSDFSEDDFFSSFVKGLNNIKLCQENADGCFYDEAIKYLNGGKPSETYNTKNSFITADGAVYQWLSGNEHCASKGISDEDAKNCFGRFIVDLNGHKKPNVIGKDVFFFAVINTKGIIPAGSGNNSEKCSRSSTGSDCAAKVLKESAISYY